MNKIVSNATTVILVVCALSVTALAARRELLPPAPPERSPTQPAPDWLEYAREGHRLGPPNAPVALVEFADFECPACRVFEARLVEARRTIRDDFTVVYRHFPLDIHPLAASAAEASECAGAQGQFARMHDSLFQQQNVFRSAGWRAIASTAGVADLDRFDRCLRDSSARDEVRRDVAAARHLGATGTPTILINGVRLSGVPSQRRLEELIREAIRR